MLRFLSANNYNHKKTVESIVAHQNMIPFILGLTLDSDVQKYLEMGCFSICGRDNHYRPVVNLRAKQQKLYNKLYGLDALIKSVGFTMNFVVT